MYMYKATKDVQRELILSDRIMSLSDCQRSILYSCSILHMYSCSTVYVLHVHTTCIVHELLHVSDWMLYTWHQCSSVFPSNKYIFLLDNPVTFAIIRDNGHAPIVTTRKCTFTCTCRQCMNIFNGIDDAWIHFIAQNIHRFKDRKVHVHQVTFTNF